MSKSPYKSKATPRPQKPKAPPRPSMFEFTPYIVALQERMERDQVWLQAMYNKEFLPEPAIFGLSTVEEVYNKIVGGRNYCAKILRNWQVWSESSSPVTVMDDKKRIIIDLSDPDCFWHEADLDSLNETKYVKRVTTGANKWRDIINLRGCLLKGSEMQTKVIIRVYLEVFKAYVYHHGFSGWDEFGIIPHSNWREKMGSMYNGKVNILK